MLNNGDYLNCINSNIYFYDDNSDKIEYTLILIDKIYNTLEKCGETCKTCIIPSKGIVYKWDIVDKL